MEDASDRLPPGVRARPASEGDLGAVFELIKAADVTDVGEQDYTLEDIAGDWRVFDLARDTWLLESDGRLIGYAEAHVRTGAPPDCFGLVHPEWRGRGLGSWLVSATEARAVETATAGRTPHSAEGEALLHHWVHHEVAAAGELLQGRGYRLVRSSYRMSVPLDGESAAPALPEGVVVRSVAQGVRLRDVHAASQASFAGQWGFVPLPFDTWTARRTERATFDPSLWLAAEAEGRVVAVALSEIDGDAWLNTLGVIPEWRGRGLGRAMLIRAFRALAARGAPKAVLDVDAENETGALRLYESAGMTIDRQYDCWLGRVAA